MMLELIKFVRKQHLVCSDSFFSELPQACFLRILTARQVFFYTRLTLKIAAHQLLLQNCFTLNNVQHLAIAPGYEAKDYRSGGGN
jgi:hypothetical protein